MRAWCATHLFEPWVARHIERVRVSLLWLLVLVSHHVAPGATPPRLLTPWALLATQWWWHSQLLMCSAEHLTPA